MGARYVCVPPVTCFLAALFIDGLDLGATAQALLAKPAIGHVAVCNCTYDAARRQHIHIRVLFYLNGLRVAAGSPRQQFAL